MTEIEERLLAGERLADAVEDFCKGQELQLAAECAAEHLEEVVKNFHEEADLDLQSATERLEDAVAVYRKAVPRGCVIEPSDPQEALGALARVLSDFRKAE